MLPDIGVEEWDAVLARLRPHLAADERQTRLLATFGLLNSTPHSAVAANAPAILADMGLEPELITLDV